MFGYRVDGSVRAAVVADGGAGIATDRQLNGHVHNVVCCQVVPFVVTDDVKSLYPYERFSVGGFRYRIKYSL